MPPEIPFPEIDTFIHEPARLRVLALLTMVDEADFMFILRQTGLSRGNLSVQMTKLVETGLVQSDLREDGPRARTCYHLSAKGINALRAYKRVLVSVLETLPD